MMGKAVRVERGDGEEVSGYPAVSYRCSFFFSPCAPANRSRCLSVCPSACLSVCLPLFCFCFFFFYSLLLLLLLLSCPKLGVDLFNMLTHAPTPPTRWQRSRRRSPLLAAHLMSARPLFLAPLASHNDLLKLANGSTKVPKLYIHTCIYICIFIHICTYI